MSFFPASCCVFLCKKISRHVHPDCTLVVLQHLEQQQQQQNQWNELYSFPPRLHTLFISNNKIKAWDELTKLTQLPELSNILLVGNPLYDGLTRKAAAPHVMKQLPGLKTLDGEMMTGDLSDDVVVGIRVGVECHDRVVDV